MPPDHPVNGGLTAAGRPENFPLLPLDEAAALRAVS
jgi:hypothetical protein